MAQSKRSREIVEGALGLPIAQESVGLGVDIVDIERMERIIARSPAFVRRVFTEDEQAYCNSTNRPAAHYATRFAAKEAVAKALGCGFTQGVKPILIEVRRLAKGRPAVTLWGAARAVAKEQGVKEIPLSLSFTHSEAVACAMTITENSVAASAKRVDPTEALTRSFKEARSFLDELPVKGQTDTEEPPVLELSDD